MPSFLEGLLRALGVWRLNWRGLRRIVQLTSRSNGSTVFPLMLLRVMPTTRLIVLRHGETCWNREGRFQGHLDSPLTSVGIRQGQALARRLAGYRFSALYSSDLGRAEATARIIAEASGQEVCLDARLRERHLGVLQGQLVSEARQKFPEAYDTFKRGVADKPVPGGESNRERFE